MVRRVLPFKCGGCIEYVLFSIHFVHAHCANLYVNIYCCSKCSISGSLDSVGQEWLHENRAGSVSVNRGFFAHLFCLMQHRISYVLHASRVLTAPLLCASISQRPLLQQALCLFYMNSPTDPCWPQITSKEKVRELSKGGKYLLRPLKAFANKGDPSTAFKMSLAGFVHLHNL